MQGKILVIDNERRMCHVLKSALELDKHEVEVAYDGEAGLKKIRQNEFDVVITDLKMPGMDGIGVLEQVKKISPRAEVILMTAYATAQTAVEAMRKGAYDYLIKPFDMIELKLKIKQVLEKKNLATENVNLKERLRDKFSLDNIIGQSEAMQQVYRMVEKVAP
ncbi:Fis family transcriptional regulator, partial [candidate division KSB1 bacterium 4484_87]